MQNIIHVFLYSYSLVHDDQPVPSGKEESVVLGCSEMTCGELLVWSGTTAGIRFVSQTSCRASSVLTLFIPMTGVSPFFS